MTKKPIGFLEFTVNSLQFIPMGSLRDSKKVSEHQITRLSDGEGQLSEGQIESEI